MVGEKEIEDREREISREGENTGFGGVIKRYGFLMWSHGPRWVAVNAALKYITHPGRSRWG